MAAKVLIPIEFDTSKLAPALEQLGKQAALSDSAVEAYAAGNVELRKRNDLLAQEQKSMQGLDSAGKKQIATLGQVERAADKAAGAVIQMSGKEFQDALKKSGKSVDDFVASLAKEEQQAKKTETSMVSLKSEKKKLQAQIAQLIIDGKQESAMFLELTQRAGQIDDAISDANDAIRRTGSDTRGLDTVIQLARGVTAGFAIAQGAAALFGDENQNVQKVLLKVQAAMAILNGLQEIQTLLKSEYIKTLKTAITTQVINNAQIAIENGLQSSSIVIRTLATAAQKLLNAAVSANPYILAAVALGTLVAVMVSFTSQAEQAAQAQSALDAAIQSSQGGLQAELDTYDRIGKKRIADLQAAGATQSQIDQEELQTMHVKAQATADELQRLNQIIKANEANAEDVKAAYAERARLEKSLQDQNTEGYIKTKDYEKDLREEHKKSAEDAKRLAEEADRKAKERADKARKRAELEINDRKAGAELALLYAQKGGQDELELRIDIIQQEAALALNAENVTANQRKFIQAKAEKDIVELRKQYALRAQKDQLDIETRKAELVLELAKMNWGEYSDQAIAAQKVLLNRQAQLEIFAEQQSEDTENVKAQKILAINQALGIAIEKIDRDTNARLLQQQADFIESLEQLQIDRLKRQADDVTLGEMQRFKALQNSRKAELELIQGHISDLDAKYAAGNLTFEEYEKQKTELVNQEEAKRQEITNAYAERKKEVLKQIAAAAIQIAQEIVSTEAAIDKQYRDANLQQALDDLNTQKEAAINAKNLTEREKANIKKKFDAQERRIRREAARAERRAQVGQALASTALGIINIIATAPNYIVGIIEAAAYGITAALQISKIRSAPLGYKTGTKQARPGYQWVGEDGPELMKFKGGEEVHKHYESIHLQRKWDFENAMPSNHSDLLSDYSVNGSGSLEIDYDRLGETVAKHVKHETVTVQNTFDEHGHALYIHRTNSRQKVLNKRYSTRA